MHGTLPIHHLPSKYLGKCHIKKVICLSFKEKNDDLKNKATPLRYQAILEWVYGNLTCSSSQEDRWL